MGRRELLLLTVSVALTLALGLAGLRLFAPALLGQPVNLQLVELDESVVPFFDNVFRPEDAEAERELLPDPVTVVRGRPLADAKGGGGPSDLLGFRNHAVPRRPGVVAIGDSQTYGLHVPLESAWPKVLEAELGVEVYSMALGGWGAVQYLDMFEKALRFRPKAAVVVFYTGNDARDSFRVAYGTERWAKLRPDPALGRDDLPESTFPPPPGSSWPVRLADGTRRTFTPGVRLASNRAHPGIEAGLAVMEEVASRVAARGRREGVAVVLAVLPTKELVYAERLRREGVELDPDYAALVAAEPRNLARLESAFSALPGARYVDLLAPLQRGADERPQLYSTNADGHLRQAGHRVVAAALAPAVAEGMARSAGPGASP